MLPYREGGWLPAVGDGGSLITHNAGSQSIAFKYVMASEPYTGKPVKQVMAGLPFLKHLYIIESKMFLNLT